MTEGPLLKHMRAQNAALREEIVREIANLPQADLRGVLRMIERWKGAQMTDDLVERWDEYVESMGSVMGDVEHMAQQMRDRIEALTAERDRLASLNVELCDNYNTLLVVRSRLQDRADAAEADNARLRGACEGAVNWLDALAEQINATSCDPDDPEAFDEVLMGAGMFLANARAALNTGKEPSHD